MAYTRTQDQEATPEWSPDGVGNKRYQETYYGENAYDKDVDNYRERGNPLDMFGKRKQQAVALDQTNADQARGFEMGSLGQLQTAAAGGAPSQAAILSRGATEAAGEAGAAAQQGGHGNPLGAARAAQAQVASTAQQNAGQMMQLRNKESAADMGAFAGAAGAVRGQDIGAATTNAQFEAQQRALEQQRQQANERMAYDTRRVQNSAAMESSRQAAAEDQRRRANDAARTAADWDKAMTVVRTAASLGTAAAKANDAEVEEDPRRTSGSDKRMKMHVGSLAGFGGR